ncbi:MAG: hypothetical protein LBL33_07780, partial [Tannerella sp.]|nr:hypothetical protein [Tannerella sp.]
MNNEEIERTLIDFILFTADGLYPANVSVCHVVVFMETKNHMFMRGTTFGKNFRLVYFKDRNTGYNIVSNSSEELRNDMDEGPDFFPDGIMNDGRAYKSFSLY